MLRFCRAAFFSRNGGKGTAACPPADTSGRSPRREMFHSQARPFAQREWWAFDGKAVWVLQLQQEAALSNGAIIVPGITDHEVEFDVTTGLDALRSLVARVKGTSTGIKLVGKVGLTSHIADVLRRNNIPSR